MVKIKRIYEPASPDDGCRILVDRLWPRGVAKATAALDNWNKDVAPSPELRTWFGHDPVKFSVFRTRYLQELSVNPSATKLRDLASSTDLTLLYAAKDPDHNHALVLRDFLTGREE